MPSNTSKGQDIMLDSRRRSSVSLQLVALPFLICASASCAAEPGFPDGGDDWTRASPESVQFDAVKLEELTAAIRRQEYVNVHAVLIHKDDHLVYEEYFAGMDDPRGGAGPGFVTFDATTRHDLRSVTKSVTSALVGIALGSGMIRSLDQPIFEFFPEHADLATPDKLRITVRHVLTMSAGLEWSEAASYGDSINDERRMNRSEDPIRFVLSRPLATEPGASFNYSGGLTQLLAAIVQRAAGRHLLEYAREVLFAPLGITDVEWVENWPGMPSAASGLRMRPPDLAKFGLLYLSDGRWLGRQVIAESWIRESSRRHFTVSDADPADDAHGYTLQWWHSRFDSHLGELEVLNAAGNGGQNVFVVPRLRMVVTMLGGRYNPVEPDWTTEDILLERIIPALRSQ